MTYFAFLAYFLFIPILVLLAIPWFNQGVDLPTPGFDARKTPLIILVHVFLALAYTTPWDNYLVATGVWHYNPELVTGLTFGYVPIEEYTFFVAETILAGLWWWFLARRLRAPGGGRRPNNEVYQDRAAAPAQFNPNRKLISLSTALLGAVWAFFTFQFFFGPDSWNYLGIIFFWALPAILPQLLFGADILWHHRKLVFWTVLPPALYLSLIDIVALKSTTWQISQHQTLGIVFWGILPVEEVVFFFITNILIGFGMTLMLSKLGWERFSAWKARGFRGLP